VSTNLLIFLHRMFVGQYRNLARPVGIMLSCPSVFQSETGSELRDIISSISVWQTYTKIYPAILISCIVRFTLNVTFFRPLSLIDGGESRYSPLYFCYTSITMFMFHLLHAIIWDILPKNLVFFCMYFDLYNTLIIRNLYWLLQILNCASFFHFIVINLFNVCLTFTSTLYC
jgi:hypothetical protein